MQKLPKIGDISCLIHTIHVQNYTHFQSLMLGLEGSKCKFPCLRHPPLSRGNSFDFLAPLETESLVSLPCQGKIQKGLQRGWGDLNDIFLTFTSNILQLNCYDIFIFYTVYRNVIIDIMITIILSTYMNQSNLMIIQNFVILSFIISYLVCDQEWILYIIIFRSPILWNQVNSIPQKLCKMK